MKIICTILFVFSIVGACLSLLGIILLPITRSVVLYESKTLEIILAENGTNYMTALSGAIAGFLGCVIGIFICKYNQLFFAKELEVGTPFTKEIVHDMRKMALVNILVSVVGSGVIVIMLVVLKKIYPEITDTKESVFGSVAFGLIMLLLSVFCEYPVEKEEQNSKENN